jgi:hypothetical protein
MFNDQAKNHRERRDREDGEAAAWPLPSGLSAIRKVKSKAGLLDITGSHPEP